MNSRATAGCEACAKWCCLSFLFVNWGLRVVFLVPWLVSSNVRFIYSFPLFYFLFCSSFWTTARYKAEILKNPLNLKQETNQTFRGINSQVAKSGSILEYF